MDLVDVKIELNDRNKELIINITASNSQEKGLYVNKMNDTMALEIKIADELTKTKGLEGCVLRDISHFSVNKVGGRVDGKFSQH